MKERPDEDEGDKRPELLTDEQRQDILGVLTAALKEAEKQLGPERAAIEFERRIELLKKRREGLEADVTQQ